MSQKTPPWTANTISKAEIASMLIDELATKNVRYNNLYIILLLYILYI